MFLMKLQEIIGNKQNIEEQRVGCAAVAMSALWTAPEVTWKWTGRLVRDASMLKKHCQSHFRFSIWITIVGHHMDDRWTWWDMLVPYSIHNHAVSAHWRMLKKTKTFVGQNLRWKVRFNITIWYICSSPELYSRSRTELDFCPNM